MVKYSTGDKIIYADKDNIIKRGTIWEIHTEEHTSHDFEGRPIHFKYISYKLFSLCDSKIQEEDIIMKYGHEKI